MSKYICMECSYSVPKWEGRCPGCESWNSFTQEELYKKRETTKKIFAKKIEELETSCLQRSTTGITEIDRVLGGGLNKGSLILLAGHPGSGKSTLICEIVRNLSDKKILYTSGEESEQQVGDRFKRLNIENENLFIACESKWENIKYLIEDIRPDLLIVDSIQTTYSEEIQSSPGTVTQVKEVTYRLMSDVKANDLTTFVIGHITKEGGVAGPKILEHMVDTVLHLEGDRDTQLRILRASKNRFGMNNEIGVLEMTSKGLRELKEYESDIDVPDSNKIGSAYTSILEGSRNFLVEVQSLVSKYDSQSPRKFCEGVDFSRVVLVCAVMEKYLNTKISNRDLFINVTNGLKINKGESDLAIIASLLSSYLEKKLPENTVFIGELGLSGEIRKVNKINERLRSFYQMGVKKVFVPEGNMLSLNKSPLEIISLKRVEELRNIF